MFPRIKKVTRKGTKYEYLVISESIHVKGKTNKHKSTTKDIVNLGNVNNFRNIDINNVIDGLIKIFQVEKYSLTEDIKIEESLEHGSIIFWQKIWDKLCLSETIRRHVQAKDNRIKIEVEKYVELMTLNRCIDPLSKLGVTRWYDKTCYKYMKGYNKLPLEVNNFYRSMDYLLKVKEEIELSIYEKLKNLFSINVKMTFYDITSTFFYSDRCPISANGYSRDNRPEREQIVVGVVTSYEGYPIKHYVFEGNTKDETTVQEVVQKLKSEYNIEETTFVGDRGMISKLNLEKIIEDGYKYILGVKGRQDEICEMLFTEEEIIKEYTHEMKGLKIKETKVEVKEFMIWKIRKILEHHKISVNDNFKLLDEKIRSLTNKSEFQPKEIKPILEKLIDTERKKIFPKIHRTIKKYIGKYEDEFRYVISLNEERKESAQLKREKKIELITKELDKIFSPKKDVKGIEKSISKVFEGYKSRYKRYIEIKREENNKAIGYSINKVEIEKSKNMDGIFILLTNRNDMEIKEVVTSYKNLKEIEMLFDDFKNFVDVRPIRHWLEVRVRSHVFHCILALLLKRIFEINYLKGKSTTEALEEIEKSKLIKYKVKFSEREARNKVLLKVTNTNPSQIKYFNLIGIKNPMGLEKFIWY